ncbi:MAG TPA: cytochrome b/b6 domain-containing protein [Woeseiaceae bacterium]|nr:cytochrome b/b6 domain-containing protein [Woeseiaceae bacterium]
MSVNNDTVKVWDPLVRIGHWILVAGFFTAYFTEEELLTQHTWAGYVVAGVVLLRIVWGFIGSEHARFRDFVRAPGETLRYLGEIATNRAKRFIGHNPAGGAMVVALLLSLVVTTWSGLEIYAIEENAGPLAGLYGATGPQLPSLVATAHASDDDRGDERERAEEFWEEVHEVAANLTLLLVLLHVAGVVIASRAHHENLVKAMLTGRKRRDASPVRD